MPLTWFARPAALLTGTGLACLREDLAGVICSRHLDLPRTLGFRRRRLTCQPLHAILRHRLLPLSHDAAVRHSFHEVNAGYPHVEWSGVQ